MPGLLPRHLLAPTLLTVGLFGCSENRVPSFAVTSTDTVLVMAQGVTHGAGRFFVPELNPSQTIRAAFGN
jgi:hypothetical protein